MKSKEKAITVQNMIHAPVEKVWKCFTTPDDILKWNNASEDWHTTKAENDLQPGGKFCYRMEAKDGSFGFDFEGIYEQVLTNELIVYMLGDGRRVSVDFIGLNNKTEVIETFEAENENPHELQRAGWQSILDNLKKHVEKN